jgi:glycosyltransferase involved in cell wall biosynthesis
LASIFIQKIQNIGLNIFNTGLTNMEKDLIDVIMRTRNSEETLEQCLHSLLQEIPVRRIVIVDSGSTDRTLEIASSFDKVEIHSKPGISLGEATKYAFSKAKTEWVAVIDSDIVLRSGWFADMRGYMNRSDAVEGCRVNHYKFDFELECTKIRHGIFGHTLIKREPVLGMDLDLPYAEDAAIKFYFEKRGLKWLKVQNSMADHYPKIQGTTYLRTGTVYRPCAVYIPKERQIEEGHIYRQFEMMTKKEVLARLILPPIRDAARAFKCRFWFCLAYFKII